MYDCCFFLHSPAVYILYYKLSMMGNLLLKALCLCLEGFVKSVCSIFIHISRFIDWYRERSHLFKLKLSVCIINSLLRIAIQDTLHRELALCKSWEGLLTKGVKDESRIAILIMNLERITALNLLPNNRILNLLLIFLCLFSIRSFLLLLRLRIAGLVLNVLSLEV